MEKKKHIDLRYVDSLQGLSKSPSEHRIVKERLVYEGIYPDSKNIPTGLVSFVIESLRNAYDAGYKEGSQESH